ncbi:MAG TPA: hypothetical protein VII69_13475 [Candidatus Eremiobacteraceae bacterium]
MLARSKSLTSYALSAAATIALLVGCSGGSSVVVPGRAMPEGDAHDWQFKTHDACPATGAIEYVSDGPNHAVNVYAGRFASQAPCGQITVGLTFPAGLFVQTSTHDLYVADLGSGIVEVYHRGQTTPYKNYKDPSNQNVEDVAVAPDGTVLATNYHSRNKTERGSISTWIGGPNGGTFVGNFPMQHSKDGWNITVRNNGIVYFSYVTRNWRGELWKMRCPAGACGTQTQIAGVLFEFPGGMQFDASDDLVAADQAGLAETFELPNPSPKTFPVGDPVGMALSESDHHLFVADQRNNDAAEYSYPGGKLIGTVPGMPFGLPYGIAFDP